jgi:hypothetical protein
MTAGAWTTTVTRGALCPVPQNYQDLLDSESASRSSRDWTPQASELGIKSPDRPFSQDGLRSEAKMGGRRQAGPFAAQLRTRSVGARKDGKAR